MTVNQDKFNGAAVGEKFQATCEKFNILLSKGNSEELLNINQKLQKELKIYQDDGIIKVALVGQYSAGKSTIISALTGRRDIKIDSDIATDRTTSYIWNGINVIDTPGLFTDRKDHDEITYEAISKADLLVFCLTYMLFDTITVENFKKLAYDEGYRWKIMLVINKMSDEAGEETEKIVNYRQSLTEALKPFALDEFPVCFIDAKDYCEGVDEAEDLLLDISRFSTFIDNLNEFVDSRAYLARFDTPVRIALSYVDQSLDIVSRNSNNGDSAFLAILSQLSLRVRKERDRLRTKVQTIALDMSSAVGTEGSTLATAVGVSQDFEMLLKQAEINLQHHYEKAETKLQQVIDAAIEDIKQAVEEVFANPLVIAFIACLDKNQSISAKKLGASVEVEQIKQQVNLLKIIGETAGVKLTNLATRNFAKTAGEGFLRSMDVVGSGLHQSVLNIGKFAGFKFKPWQAVGVAKNISNSTKFLGPALGVVALGLDVLQIQKDYQQEKKMADIRREITSEFQKIAKDLENQLQIQLSEFEQQGYGEVDKRIAQARQHTESAIASSNQWVQQLVDIREDFDSILVEIEQARKKP
jgi:GTP-binding protein EngB required for normal cell division